MNLFQKQLIINGKSQAELPDLEGKFYARPLVPPARVSVVEFEATQHRVQSDVCHECGAKFLNKKSKRCIQCGTRR